MPKQNKKKVNKAVGLNIIIDDALIEMIDEAMNFDAEEKYEIQIHWKQGTKNEIRSFTVSEFLKKLGF